MKPILTFRELWSATGCFKSVFLTLFHARIASQKSCFLQRTAVLRINLEQCASNAVADCTGLAACSAAMCSNQHIVLAVCIGKTKRLLHDQFQGFQTEIVVDIAFIDDDSSFTRYQTNSGDRMLATTRSVILHLSHES